jgi:hypothetical protein
MAQFADGREWLGSSHSKTSPEEVGIRLELEGCIYTMQDLAEAAYRRLKSVRESSLPPLIPDSEKQWRAVV